MVQVIFGRPQAEMHVLLTGHFPKNVVLSAEFLKERS
jgi:hypothetical protein